MLCNEIAPVALVFYKRPSSLKKVFEKVKQAKPSKIFLIQDGPKDKKDIPLINECRNIVNDINWKCDVYRNFSKVNLGCGNRVYSGLNWAFSKTDRLIILEDDCIPSNSFFPFCTELLEKYHNDERIGIITGMNHDNFFEKTPYDYFFARAGSIAGWATWKRTWDHIDFNLNWLNDIDCLRLLRNYSRFDKKYNELLKKATSKKKTLKKSGRLSAWAFQLNVSIVLTSTLSIIPKYNLMTNIGLSKDAAHTPDSIKKIPIGLRKLYRLKNYEVCFPLKHPKYVIDDIEYRNIERKLMSPSKIIRFIRRVESIVYRIVEGDLIIILRSIPKHFFRNR